MEKPLTPVPRGKECRDFLRNMCTRGHNCKFFHPPQPEANPVPIEVQPPIKQIANIQSQTMEPTHAEKRPLQDAVVFCHDFLNNGECSRAHCRFIHCNREEETEYKRSGYFPPHVRDQAIRKGIAPDMPVHFGSRPICKDFLKGECSRTQCRFRHLTTQQYDLELDRMLRQQGGQVQGPQKTPEGPYMFERGSDQSFFDTTGAIVKRRRMEEPHPMVQYHAQQAQSDHDRSVIEMLQHENILLKQRLDELDKQVQDLRTTNEFLLDQNAHLRLGVKQSTTSVVSVAAGPQAPTQITATQSPMSLAIQQPSISITPAIVTAPVSVPSVQPMAVPQSISLSVATLPQPTSISIAPICTIAGLDGVPTTVGMPVQSLSNVTMTCHAPQDMNPQQPNAAPSPQSAPPPNTVHVQETRLVTYPITSIRQTM